MIYFNDAMVEVDTTTAPEIESQPIVWAYEPFIPIGTVTVRRHTETVKLATLKTVSVSSQKQN